MLRVPCARSLSCTGFEEIEEGIPSLWDVGDFIAGLLDQRSPEMERNPSDFHRRDVVAAFSCGVVVEIGSAHRHRCELRFLRLDDVAEVEELVRPKHLTRRTTSRGLP